MLMLNHRSKESYPIEDAHQYSRVVVKVINLMNFTIVILDEHVGSYPRMQWSDWKDDNRKQMISQGDHWSKTTLEGSDIWDCLETNKIDPQHVVQWKPASDKLHKVSLPRQTHLLESSRD